MSKFLISLISLLFVLGSCSTKDEQFCKCLKAGEELNALSQKVLSGEITSEEADQLVKLKENKKKECTEYQTMSGQDMLVRKAQCQ